MKDGRELRVTRCTLMFLINGSTLRWTGLTVLSRNPDTTYQTGRRILRRGIVRPVYGIIEPRPLRFEIIHQIILLTYSMHHLFECIAVQRISETVWEPPLVHHRCNFLQSSLVMGLGKSVVLLTQTWWNKYLNHFWEYVCVMCVCVYICISLAYLFRQRGCVRITGYEKNAVRGYQTQKTTFGIPQKQWNQGFFNIFYRTKSPIVRHKVRQYNLTICFY